MTRKVGNFVFIEEGPSRECELCHKIAELRPYGPNREWICFECGMKDEKTTAQKFAEFLEGPSEMKKPPHRKKLQ